MGINEVLLAASGLLSTVYGFGERNCGDVGSARPCELGATTASGVAFDPRIPMVAVAAPFTLDIDARFIFIRTSTSRCMKVLLADKMNERYIGVRGFDLTPAAVKLLTGKEATPYWSDKVFLCKPYNEHWEFPTNIARQ
jgi:hypothetical protein